MTLESIPRSALEAATAAALLAFGLQAFAAFFARRRARRRVALRMVRAAQGESRAASLLARHGFVVLGAQVAVRHAVCIDTRVVEIALRADYLAEKNGARYVVEVKTGARAPLIETSATRRQILEYRVAFDVDGVVLVDAERGTVHDITFPALDKFSRDLAEASHPANAGLSLEAFLLIAGVGGIAIAWFALR